MKMIQLCKPPVQFIANFYFFIQSSYRFLFTLIVVSLFIPIAFASKSDDQQSLLNELNGMQTFQAQFNQLVRDDRGTILQRGKGKIAVQRPNRFYWELTSPVSQIVVTNGKKIWIYDRDLEQVTIKPFMASMKDTPAALLVGDANGFKRQYNIALKSTKNSNETRYELRAKNRDALFSQVQLVFKQHVLQKMELRDQLGQSTSISFSGVRTNQPLKSNLFNFTPPPHTDVINTAD